MTRRDYSFKTVAFDMLLTFTVGYGVIGGIDYALTWRPNPQPKFDEMYCIHDGMESKLDEAHPDLQNDKSLSRRILVRKTYLSGEAPESPIGQELEEIAKQGETARELVEKDCSENPYHYW